jgi:AAA domain
MNYHNLYTLERFRPAKPALTPANDHRGARRLRAPIRPNAETRDKRFSTEDPVEIHRFVDLKERLKPLHYAIEGIVCRRRIYTCTGSTNAGKTTLWTMAALAVAAGRSDILNLDVEKGRVLYLAIENPYDTISRFAIAQEYYDISNARLNDQLFIVRVKATPEEVFTALKRLAKSGPFALVIVDTLAAFFDGMDLNNNVEAGNFIRRLRQLTTVLGSPAVIVPAHPTKGADRSKLSPYGGGAILNEVDGNLALWRQDETCRLHWQTKFRGPDFAPVSFRFRTARCDEVVDAKGRRVPMPILLPLRRRAPLPPPVRTPSAPVRPQPRPSPTPPRARPTPPRAGPAPARAEGGGLPLRDLSQDRQRSAASNAATPDTKLLLAMSADPRGTQADWAMTIQRAKSNVNRRLMRLKTTGLVHWADGRWTVTENGKRTVFVKPKWLNHVGLRTVGRSV